MIRAISGKFLKIKSIKNLCAVKTLARKHKIKIPVLCCVISWKTFGQFPACIPCHRRAFNWRDVPYAFVAVDRICFAILADAIDFLECPFAGSEYLLQVPKVRQEGFCTDIIRPGTPASTNSCTLSRPAGALRVRILKGFAPPSWIFFANAYKSAAVSRAPGTCMIDTRNFAKIAAMVPHMAFG